MSKINLFSHDAISNFEQMNYEKLSYQLGPSVSFKTVLYLILHSGTEKKIFTQCSSKIVAINATFNLSTNIEGVNIIEVTDTEIEISALSSNRVRFSIIQLMLMFWEKHESFFLQLWLK